MIIKRSKRGIRILTECRSGILQIRSRPVKGKREVCGSVSIPMYYGPGVRTSSLWMLNHANNFRIRNRQSIQVAYNSIARQIVAEPYINTTLQKQPGLCVNIVRFPCSWSGSESAFPSQYGSGSRTTKSVWIHAMRIFSIPDPGIRGQKALYLYRISGSHSRIRTRSTA